MCTAIRRTGHCRARRCRRCCRSSTCTKYPPSLLYLLLTLGAAIVVVGRVRIGARQVQRSVANVRTRAAVLLRAAHRARASRRRHHRVRDGIRHGAAQRRLHDGCRSSWGFGLPVVYLAWLLVDRDALSGVPLVRCSEAAARRLVAVLSVEPLCSAAASREQGSAAVTTFNHQFRLAARPVGLPKRSDWNYTEEPVRAPNEGEVLVKIAYLSLDPAMRGWMNDVQVVHPAGGDRRSDARGRRRRSGRIAASRIQAGRPRLRHCRRPGVRDCRRQGADESRSAPRAAAGVSRHARHAGHDRVLRPARRRQAAARPDGRRLRRGRRGRHGGRTDREDQGLSRSRHRRRRARSATTSCASSASTPRSTTSRRT